MQLPLQQHASGLTCSNSFLFRLLRDLPANSELGEALGVQLGVQLSAQLGVKPCAELCAELGMKPGAELSAELCVEKVLACESPRCDVTACVAELSVL